MGDTPARPLTGVRVGVGDPMPPAASLPSSVLVLSLFG